MLNDGTSVLCDNIHVQRLLIVEAGSRLEGSHPYPSSDKPWDKASIRSLDNAPLKAPEALKP